MKDFKSSEELRQYLLNSPGDSEEALVDLPGECFSLSWKKDHWVVRANNKKVGTVTQESIPEHLNIQDDNLLFDMLKVLREASKMKNVNPLEELNKYLEDLNEDME